MDADEVFRASFWTLLALMCLTRSWFCFRVWRVGERIGADRVARAREGVLPHVLAYLAVLLLVVVLFHVWIRGGSIRTFSFAAPIWLRCTGVVLGLASVGLFVWTHLVLGRFWSPYLQLRPEHRLVMAGPYARIRHPMYSAILGWMASLGLVMANWIPLIFTALVATNFLLRIKGEEKMLLEQFGDDYRAYMRRSGKLLPALASL